VGMSPCGCTCMFMDVYGHDCTSRHVRVFVCLGWIYLCMCVCHFACVYCSVYHMYISISMVVPLYIYAHVSLSSHLCILMLFLCVLRRYLRFPSCLSSTSVRKCQCMYACIWEQVHIFHICICMCFCLYSHPAFWGMQYPCIGIPLRLSLPIFLLVYVLAHIQVCSCMFLSLCACMFVSLLSSVCLTACICISVWECIHVSSCLCDVRFPVRILRICIYACLCVCVCLFVCCPLYIVPAVSLSVFNCAYVYMHVSVYVCLFVCCPLYMVPTAALYVWFCMVVPHSRQLYICLCVCIYVCACFSLHGCIHHFVTSVHVSACTCVWLSLCMCVLHHIHVSICACLSFSDYVWGAWPFAYLYLPIWICVNVSVFLHICFMFFHVSAQARVRISLSTYVFLREYICMLMSLDVYVSVCAHTQTVIHIDAGMHRERKTCKDTGAYAEIGAPPYVCV
jgi:hypothetical protein